jgi:hypothetical protein
MVRRALIAITDGIDQGTFILLLTDPLRAFIRDFDSTTDCTFDWTKTRIYPQLEVIYRLLMDFGLQKGGIDTVDLMKVTTTFVHPLPVGSESCPFSKEWSREMGKVYTLHERCRPLRPFVGVVCMSAFSGGPLGIYEESCTAFLPLVGPIEALHLDDAYVWDLRLEWANRTITFDEAKRNVHVIGGKFNKGKGTSHNQVTFVGGRTWPLDSNLAEIPDNFLTELTDITGYKLAVVKYALVEGELPPRKKRFNLVQQ